MTDNDPIIEQIRAADPARNVDLREAPYSLRARRMLDDIIDGDEPRGRPSGRLSRRGLVTMVAAATIALSSVGAVAAGMFSPDPRDIEGILDSAADAADAHLPGWRPTLNSETVLCVYADGRTASTLASEFPLDEPLTEDDLKQECATGNDVVRSGLVDEPSEMTLCEANVSTEALEARIAEVGYDLVAGRIEGAGYPLPVVLGWDDDCSSFAMEGRPHLELRSLNSLEAVNKAREVEVGLKAAELETCLTESEAIRIATEARRALPGEWPLLQARSDVVRPCRTIQFDVEWGFMVMFGTSRT